MSQGDQRPKRGEIHLGDLARALGTLDWRDDAEAQAIAACLGFGLIPKAEPKPQTEIYDRQRYPERAPARPQEPTPKRFSVPPAPQAPIGLPKQQLSSQLNPLGRLASSRRQAKSWSHDKPVLYDVEEKEAAGRATLFPRNVSRHIVSSALATLRVGQQIDIEQLVGQVCRLKPIRDVPRLPEPTLELGCLLLLDYSPSMVPFWEDLNALIGQVMDVAGKGNVKVYSFAEQPGDAVRWTPAGERLSWCPDKKPVLVASDFGVPLKTDRAELSPSWRTLIEACERDGSPLLVLIPWSQTHWPRDLGGYPELIHWSPDTTATQIVNAIGLGHTIEK